MTPVTLCTARLELRTPADEDAEAITLACQDPEIPRWTVVPSPYGIEDAHQFIALVAKWWANDEETTWAIRHDEKLIGMIGLHQISGNVDGGQAEIGFWITGDARGAGFMTEAAGAVIDWGFAERGLARIEWRSAAGNIPSARTARSLGFRYEGLLRQGHASPRGRADAWIAGLLKSDDRFPTSWPTLNDEGDA